MHNSGEFLQSGNCDKFRNAIMMSDNVNQPTIQILTVLSVQAVARNLPLGENWTRKTGAVWVRVMTSAFWI